MELFKKRLKQSLDMLVFMVVLLLATGLFVAFLASLIWVSEWLFGDEEIILTFFLVGGTAIFLFYQLYLFIKWLLIEPFITKKKG